MWKILTGLILVAALAFLIARPSERLEVPSVGGIPPNIVNAKRADNNIKYFVNEEGIYYRGVKTVYGRWINYKGEEDWREIPNGTSQAYVSFRETPSGFIVDEAPFEFTAPLRSTGTALFHNNNRWDNVDKKIITADPLDMTIRALGVADVAGEIEMGNIKGVVMEYIIYRNAYPLINADLIYLISFGKAPQAEKLIKFNSVITQDQDFDFEYIYSDSVQFKKRVENGREIWNEIVTLNTQKDIAVKAKNTNQRRGIGFKNFNIWDSKIEPKKEPADVKMRRSGVNKYLFIKTTHASFFTPDVVYPVYTDAVNRFFSEDAGHGNMVDGRIQCDTNGACANATFAEARDATAANNDGDDTETNQNAVYFFNQGISARQAMNTTLFMFDTGDRIEASSVINGAKFRFYVNSKNNVANDDDDFVALIQVNSASDTALVAGDYNNITDMADSNPHSSAVEYKDMADFSTTSTSWIDITNLATSAFVEIPLNATGTDAIAKASGGLDSDGITGLGIMEGHLVYNHPVDLSGTESKVNIDFAEGTNIPSLEIDFASGTPAAVPTVGEDTTWFEMK